MNYPLYILIALQLLDLISTVLSLRNPNNFEQNIILNPLFKLFGPLPVLIVFKAAMIGFLLYEEALIPQEILWLISAGYAYVVAKNFSIMKSS